MRNGCDYPYLRLLLLFCVCGSSLGFRDGASKTDQVKKPFPERRQGENSRTKRFIVAFQVTRPPGLFQLSMRRPVIMGVMSNMTSMMLGSELGRLLSRGLSGNNPFLIPVQGSQTKLLYGQGLRIRRSLIRSHPPFYGTKTVENGHAK